MDYDINGDFIRLWVPELMEIPGSKIHSPWLLSSGALAAAKVHLGENYPNPIIVAPEWSRHPKGGRVSILKCQRSKLKIKIKLIRAISHRMAVAEEVDHQNQEASVESTFTSKVQEAKSKKSAKKKL